MYRSCLEFVGRPEIKFLIVLASFRCIHSHRAQVTHREIKLNVGRNANLKFLSA